MRRRDFLSATGLATVGTSLFPLGWVSAAEKKPLKILYYTRSTGYEHSAVKRGENGELSVSDQALIAMGKRAGFEVTCTKDGRVFDGDLDQYDLFAFYCCGNQCAVGKRPENEPITPEGKQRLLDAVCYFLPCPLDIEGIEAELVQTGEKIMRSPSRDEPLAALSFKTVADSFVQQYAGPATSQYDRHCSSGCGHSFQLHDGLSHSFLRVVERQITIKKVIQIGTGTAAGITLFSPTVLFEYYADIQSYQRPHVGGQCSIRACDQHQVLAATHADNDLLNTRIDVTSGFLQARHQCCFLLIANARSRVGSRVQGVRFATLPGRQ